ncbi:MAG: acyl carrier protein [Kordiimonas sp.]
MLDQATLTDRHMHISKEKILVYLLENGAATSPLNADDALFSSGLLDSVTMMNLIMFIEENCRFQIQPQDVTLENFDTVSKIIGYINEQP